MDAALHRPNSQRPIPQRAIDMLMVAGCCLAFAIVVTLGLGLRDGLRGKEPSRHEAWSLEQRVEQARPMLPSLRFDRVIGRRDWSALRL